MHAIERLTERQKACLRLVGQGFTSKEIGRQIGISPVTVDNYMREALSVLRVPTRAEAARLLSTVDQPLMGQPQPIAGPTLTLQPNQPADTYPTWRALVFPPLGGKRNSLDVRQTWFAVIAVAVLSFASLLILTLGVAAIMWLLR